MELLGKLSKISLKTVYCQVELMVIRVKNFKRHEAKHLFSTAMATLFPSYISKDLFLNKIIYLQDEIFFQVNFIFKFRQWSII